MAATENLRLHAQSHSSSIELILPRHGVVTLFGYGIQVRVDRGHLLLEDGLGPNRRSARFPRVGHGLRRLVVIGSDGVVSLAAIRWLSDQKASFVMLERDGSVLATTGPVRSSDARLRRAQALSGQSDTAIQIARELIQKKLTGQERVAHHKLLVTGTADTIARYRAELAGADSPESIRLIESQAAGAYWAAWRSLPINFPRKDELKVPDHWRAFGARVSPLTGSPRNAVNPPNAVLNYLYAILESESRLAAAALGLDPGIGVLHVDAEARDSLACDLMEAVRPDVDAFLVDWITRETLKREWFFEQRNGNCRLMSSLASRLSETAPTWGRAVAPVAEWIAQTFWTKNRKPPRGEKTLPTPLTQRRRSEGRGNEFTLDTTPAPRPKNVCAGCGVTTKDGQNCPKCGREISREKLVELAKQGRIAAQSPEAQRKRIETHLRHGAAKRAWLLSPKPDWLTLDFYNQEIHPQLSSLTISSIASTLTVSEVYAANIRAGRHRPHARHWEALARLVGVIPKDRILSKRC
jgi:CRISPR-associated endonuclease Cas1